MDDYEITLPKAPPVGTMPGVVTSVTLKAGVETMYGIRDLLVWRVTATAKDGTDYEVDTISGVDPTPKAKLTRYLAAVGVTLKPGQALKVSELAGKPCLAVLGESDDGYVELVDIVAPVG